MIKASLFYFRFERIDNRKNHHKKKSKKKNMDGNVTSSIYENRQNEFQIGLMDVVALKVPFALKLLEGDYSNLRYNN